MEGKAVVALVEGKVVVAAMVEGKAVVVTGEGVSSDNLIHSTTWAAGFVAMTAAAAEVAAEVTAGRHSDQRARYGERAAHVRI